MGGGVCLVPFVRCVVGGAAVTEANEGVLVLLAGVETGAGFGVLVGLALTIRFT